jgi:hypothetical protein
VVSNEEQIGSLEDFQPQIDLAEGAPGGEALHPPPERRAGAALGQAGWRHRRSRRPSAGRFGAGPRPADGGGHRRWGATSRGGALAGAGRGPSTPASPVRRTARPLPTPPAAGGVGAPRGAAHGPARDRCPYRLVPTSCPGRRLRRGHAGHGPTSTLEHHRVDGRARMIRMPYIYQGHGFPVRARQDSVTGGGGRGERVHGLVDRPLGSR